MTIHTREKLMDERNKSLIDDWSDERINKLGRIIVLVVIGALLIGGKILR